MKRETIIKIYKNELIETLKTFPKKILHYNKKNLNHEYFINRIFEVFFYGIDWCHIETFGYADISSIRKKFYKWRDLGVFMITYNRLMKRYGNKRIFKNLFIDSTIIQNFNCSDEVLKHYYKIISKKQLKLHIISDCNHVIHSMNVTSPTVSDNKQIATLVNGLQYKTRKNCKLIGDKGYITTTKKYKKFTLITPFRKNQKSRITKNKRHHTKINKLLLRKRVSVEYTFNHLKRTYKALSRITQRKLSNFICFVYMASTCQIIRSQKI